MSIGRFAKLSGMTIKQLRYLDEKGLLKPKLRDANNRYRYYSHDQLDRLVLIKSMRDLGVPFAEIVRLFESNSLETCLNILQQQADAINHQMQEAMLTYKQCMSYILQIMLYQGLLSSHQYRKNSWESTISIVEVPLQSVIFTRHVSNIFADNLFLERYFELKGICHKANLLITESLHAIFHDGYMSQFESRKGDLETFFPIHSPIPDNVPSRQYGGYQGVQCMHIGHYKHLREKYLHLEQWAASRAVKIKPWSIEIYLLGPDITPDPDCYVTQIIIPIEND